MLVASEGNLPGPLEWVAVAGLVLAIGIVVVIALSLQSSERVRQLGDAVSGVDSRGRVRSFASARSPGAASSSRRCASTRSTCCGGAGSR